MKILSALLAILFFTAANFVNAQKYIKPYETGDFRLDLKLPHFNYLKFNPNKEFKDSEFGFNGYGLGFEYSYRDNKFLEASAAFAMVFKFPLPAPIDADYNKNLISLYINLTDNFIKNRFSFGYGLNYSRNIWMEWTRDFDNWNGNFENIGAVTSSRTLINKNVGFTLNSYYRHGKTIHFGLIYQPSLINLNSNPDFIYEHMVSLEINWRIKLFKLVRK